MSQRNTACFAIEGRWQSVIRHRDARCCFGSVVPDYFFQKVTISPPAMISTPPTMTGKEGNVLNVI